MPPSPLTLLLAPDLAGTTSWRHLLGQGARAGWAAVGVPAFASRLGVRLGVPVRLVPRPLRVAEWARRLAQHDDGTRSYSRSRAHDLWSVAAELLAVRDRLRVAGWAGETLGGSARLRDIEDIERIDGPRLAGLVDVLETVRAEVLRLEHLPFALRVELAVARDRFDAATLRVLDALAARGAIVAEAHPDAPRAGPDTDLGRLQRALLRDDAAPLNGDGTVVVLEAETPAEAADLLARWLADKPEPHRTLLAAAEATLLDRTLVARGLPAPGLAVRSRWRPPLQVLPLRLALAFSPRDPRVALELLTLPGGPLPRHARRRLIGALKEAPGIGGPLWNKAIEEAVAEADARGETADARSETADARSETADARGEPARTGKAGAALRAAIDEWFGGNVFAPSSGIPAEKAAKICGNVSRWARRRATRDDAERAAWQEAVALAEQLEAALDTLPPGTLLSRVQLAQVHEDALGSGTALPGGPGEVGRPAVCSTPGAVLPGAREVVWWGWVGEDESLRIDPWLPRERTALLQANLTIEHRGEHRAREADAWRQPILAASERVVLIRWRASGGRPAIGHPLEDEFVARLGQAWCAPILAAAEHVCRAPFGAWAPANEALAVASRAPWPSSWSLPPARLAAPETLSFSALDRFFGCPLRFVLDEVAELRPGVVEALPTADVIVGKLTHAVLQEVALADDFDRLTSEEAGDRAQAAFDARLPGEAALLLTEGWEAERRSARAAVRRAGACLAQGLRSGQWRAVGSEVPVAGHFAGTPWTGAIDLLLSRSDGTTGLLDLKLGRSANRRAELAEGRALQLALYASGLAPVGTPIPAAYLTVGDGRLLTSDGPAFPGSTAVDGPSLDEVVRDAEGAWAWWRRVTEAGVVVARGVDGWQAKCVEVAGTPPPERGPAAVSPPCGRCAFETLCHLSVEH